MPIEFQKEEFSDAEISATLHPLVQRWFSNQFQGFSPPQRYAVVNIHHRQNTLISSPTGSGKTLSAFLSVISELTALSLGDALGDDVYCIYVSPLKALANDIQKNLDEPLAGITALALEEGRKLGIRTGIRTGDTSVSERAGMLRKPPHILITTPESLAILITAPKFREKLAQVQWVIIDEIHSLADSKRGVHLSITLERLQRIASFCRVGLSATVAPLDEVAKFLVGVENPDKPVYRDCRVVDVQYLKKLDLKVLSPVEDLMRSPHGEIHARTYALLDSLIQDHRTTLVFTNTRSATERVVHHLKDKFPRNYMNADEGPLIGAHHGSLSKEHRLAIENSLKAGKLKAVVTSTSLELGIDIGYIDLVVLLGSPKSVARALQRIGRSGHKLHDQAKGRIVVLDRDDLVECSVLLKAALEKKIDEIHIPENCLDVLAQHIFGFAIDDKQAIHDVYATVRRSYCYRTLTWQDFEDVLMYLAGEYVSLEARNVYAKIWYDRDTAMIGKRGRLARVLYMTNIGTIPDETHVRVKTREGALIGKIDEQFLERLKKGDVFVLGGSTYQFMYAQGMTAFVKAAVNRQPTVPSWFSEQLPLSFDLAMEIGRFRRLMEEHFESHAEKKDIVDFILSYLHVDAYGANSIYEYCHEQFAYAQIPHDHKVLVERYEEGSRTYVIVHALFGRRTNDVLSRAVAYQVAQLTGKDAEVNISDNGFYVVSANPAAVLRALRAIRREGLRDTMRSALDRSEVLTRRFRHCAARALMILRSYMGRTKSVGRQQLSSRLIFSAVKKISDDFPILKEARREVLEDMMDIKHAEEVIGWIESGRITLHEITTDIPSPFAFNLVTMGYSDILKMEDKQKFLQRMHDLVLAKIALKEARAKR